MENKKPQTKTPGAPQQQKNQPSKSPSSSQQPSNKANTQQKKPGSNW